MKILIDKLILCITDIIKATNIPHDGGCKVYNRYFSFNRISIGAFSIAL